MSFTPVSRCIASLYSLNSSNFSLNKILLFTTSSVSSSAAEQLLARLRQNDPNIEIALKTVDVKLDAPCVNQVLKNCCAQNPQMGLRFFIWAGIRPGYRHSSYMYKEACQVLGIGRNARVIDDVLESYRVENCVVSINMFKVVLNLCREAKDANLCLLVLRKMKEFGCRPDTTVYNVVIRLFCEKGMKDEAMGLMREMGLLDLHPDMITYMSLVKGLCDAGKLKDACQLVKDMKGKGCTPNVVVYSTILDGICSFGNLESAIELLREMENEHGDCRPNVVTYTTIIQSFVEKGRSLDAVRILDEMEKIGCKPNRVTMSTLIKGLCSGGHLERAHEVIDKVSEDVLRDECYSSFVLALFQIGKHREAEALFHNMLTKGLRPDGLASSTILKWICSEGRILDGFRLYDKIEKSNFVSTIDSDIYSIILDGLCQQNHLEEAAKFSSLIVRKGINIKIPFENTT